MAESTGKSGGRWGLRLGGRAAVLLCIASIGGARAGGYEFRPRFDWPDAGADIVAGTPAGTQWVHAEGDHAFVHAQSAAGVDALVPRLDFAIRECSRRLGLSPPAAGVHAILVEEGAPWRRLLDHLEARPDARAMTVRGWIVLRHPAGDTHADWAPVFYEAPHALFYALRGESPPLWLDEGLSELYGWRLARAFADRDGRHLTRKRPGIDPAVRWPLEDLTRCRSLPEEPARTRAFYRQAGDLVQILEEEIGPEGVGQMALEGKRGNGWRKFLRRHFGWRSMDFRNVKSDYLRMADR